MKNLQKLIATVLIGLILGLPVCAGDMNSPPTPGPPAPCTIVTPEGTIPDPSCPGTAPLPGNGATIIINLLARMLSIY